MVVAVLALLVAILVPSLNLAKQRARAVICRTNLAGLVRANQLYAQAFDGYYVPAAADIFVSSGGNRHRWHGVRPRPGEPFDSAAGPMAKYLGDSGRIRQCPSFTDFHTAAGAVGYEAGSGGYGYSETYIGSRFWQDGYYCDSPGQKLGARVEEVRRASDTVMFADAAMPMGLGGGAWYVEESFAYCTFRLKADGTVSTSRNQPSIHFRHGGAANVAWCDGHVTARDDMHSISRNVYQADPGAMNVGWFGPDDNSLFDLK